MQDFQDPTKAIQRIDFFEAATSQPRSFTSPAQKYLSQPIIEGRSSASLGTEDFSSPENEAPEEEQLVRRLHNALTTPKHFSFNPNAGAQEQEP